MSDSERPEITAFLELEHLVRNLGEELAGFRRRALLAENRVRELEAYLEDESGRVAPSVNAEAENVILRRKLEVATGRTRRILDRVRFLRQQESQGVV